MYTFGQYLDEKYLCQLYVNFIDVFNPSDIKLPILQVLHPSENSALVMKCQCQVGLTVVHVLTKGRHPLKKVANFRALPESGGGGFSDAQIFWPFFY